MSASDKIVVNSNFTRTIATKVWPVLEGSLGVVYPCVIAEDLEEKVAAKDEKLLWDNKFRIILSINRFERKKDIALAIKAYQGLSHAQRVSTRLIIAGGYDQRVNENVQYHKELVEMAEDSGLTTATAKTVSTALSIPDNVQILFLLSVPGPFKTDLLKNAALLLYTPTNEHFGIVPVEAMQHGVPVLAANTGGPLETIVDGKTGWHRDVAKAEAWTAVIHKVLHELSLIEISTMAENGRRRVAEHFTRQRMARKIDEELRKMRETKRSAFLEGKDILLGLGVVAAFVAALMATIFKARSVGTRKRAGAVRKAKSSA